MRRDIRYTSLTSTVPSAGLRQGVFTVPICIQATGTTCNTVLPAGTPLSSVVAINPISAQYVQHIFNNVPLPNSLSAATPFTLIFPTRQTFEFQQEIFKLDTAFTNNWTAYYRFQKDKIPTVEANSLFSSGSGIPGVSTTSTDSPGRTHTFNTTYVFSPKVILEAGYTFGYGAILSENVGLLALQIRRFARRFPMK